MKAITTWNEEDRPRERLFAKGADALKNEELLAILLRTGTNDQSAVGIGSTILDYFNNDLSALGRASLEDLTQFKGIGHAKAITILASLELGRRRIAVQKPITKISCSKDIYDYIGFRLRDLSVEEFHVILLSKSLKIMHSFCVSKGGVSATVVDLKVVFKKTLQHLASSIILVHNHPSGNRTPSHADKHLTSKIKEAASLFDIQLLDHLIIAQDAYFSFADEGLI